MCDLFRSLRAPPDSRNVFINNFLFVPRRRKAKKYEKIDERTRCEYKLWFSSHPSLRLREGKTSSRFSCCNALNIQANAFTCISRLLKASSPSDGDNDCVRRKEVETLLVVFCGWKSPESMQSCRDGRRKTFFCSLGGDGKKVLRW